MEMNIKNLSILELVEALDRYPSESHPEENQALRNEIQNRKTASHREEPGEKGHPSHPSNHFLEGWPKRKRIINCIAALLLASFWGQFFFSNRLLTETLIFTGVLVNGYFFHVFIIEYQLKKPEILAAVQSSSSLSEAMALLQGPFYLRIIQATIFVLLGAAYVFAI